MSIHARSATALAIGAAVACSSPALAADDIAYVSITGSNANACTLAAPCRTLQRGIRVTRPGGELQILDSGFFGDNANIGKSMTISGNGHTVILTNPITVNRPAATVTLRGLVLDGRGTATSGIQILDASAVHIERCVISGFTQDGISSAEPIELFITASTSRDNGGNGLLMPTALGSRLMVDTSHFDNNRANGINVQSAGTASISRSTASGNFANGIVVSNASVSVASTVASANSGAGFSVSAGGQMAIESSVASGNLSGGLIVTAAGTARISSSSFTGNDDGGIINSGGTIETLGNNTAAGNGNNVVGTLTPIGGV